MVTIWITRVSCVSILAGSLLLERRRHPGGERNVDRWAYQLPAAAMGAIEETDIEVIEPDPAFLDASNAFIAEDEVSRVAEDGAMGQHFVDLVEKWTAIVNEVGADPDALAERANEEIWSKVDWSTYGS
jgi:hypothetical protein